MAREINWQEVFLHLPGADLPVWRGAQGVLADRDRRA